MATQPKAKERTMTAVWIWLAFSVGTILGYFLCAAMSVSREEQLREMRQRIPPGMHPLEVDSRH
jgi:hypothetical protein